MRRALALAAGLVMMTTSAHASTGMELVQETRSGPLPDTCYHEDSVHIRSWRGTLDAGESFTVPLTFCSTDDVPSGPGGAGMMYKAVFWDGHQSLDLRVIAPDGTEKAAHPSFPGVLWGCVVQYLQDNDVIRTGTVQSGTYQVVLTNTGTRAISPKKPVQLAVWVAMSDRNFQDNYCPAEDRNEGPVI